MPVRDTAATEGEGGDVPTEESVESCEAVGGGLLEGNLRVGVLKEEKEPGALPD